MVDRSGKLDERNSSNTESWTVLEEQRQMIIAEYCEKIGHHELQAAHAEEERRILREELWRQQMEFREVHQQILTKMEELRKFQSSTFDTFARRKHMENFVLIAVPGLLSVRESFFIFFLKIIFVTYSKRNSDSRMGRCDCQ